MKFDTKVVRSGISPDPTTGAIASQAHGCALLRHHADHIELLRRRY